MKKTILFTLLIISLTAYSDGNENTNSVNNTSSNSSIQCNEVLTEAVKKSIENTKILRTKWAEDDGISCGVSFRVGDIDYQVDLDFDKMGTAHNKKTVGITEMTNAEMDFRVVESYKEHEQIANLGDKAIYYTRGNSHQVFVLSGDNTFTVKTINWKTRGGDKNITIKVAEKITKML